MALTSLTDSWASQVFSSISLRLEGGASRTFRNRSWAWRPQCWQVPCSTSSTRERMYVWLVRIWKSSWHLSREQKIFSSHKNSSKCFFFFCFPTLGNVFLLLWLNWKESNIVLKFEDIYRAVKYCISPWLKDLKLSNENLDEIKFLTDEKDCKEHRHCSGLEGMEDSHIQSMKEASGSDQSNGSVFVLSYILNY